ncbi:MAG: hypothetical protein GY869_15225 [Planctomycetes bacterium]|nr:hypothetical protein [Planctomycetota bacterium]
MRQLILVIFLAGLALAGTMLYPVFNQGEVVYARPVQQFEVTTAEVTGPVTLLPQATYLFTATGFDASEIVNIKMAGVRIANGRANGSGVFTANAKIPTGVVQGLVTVEAVDRLNQQIQSYDAILNPAISLSSASGEKGSPLEVDGFAFGASETVTFTFVTTADSGAADCIGAGSPVSTTLGAIRSRLNGNVSLLNISVPSVPPGTYHVVAIGSDSRVCAIN